MKILSKQNFNQNESKNFVVDNLSSAPSNPVLGQIYYNIQEERAYICIKAGEIPEWADLTLEEEVFVGKDEPDGRDIKLWIDPEDMGSITGYESMPLGSIVPYAGTTPPEGFLICDGAEIDRETYKELFKIIGTTYGSGDNSTTFNVPNIKGKTVVGLDSDDTDFNTLGKTGGSKYLQAHSHDIKTGFDYIASSGSKTSNYAKLEGVVNDFKTETSGEGNSGNLQPYITLNYIIRAISTTMLTGDVIDSLEGDSSYNAPSIHAVNTKIKELEAYSSTAINEGSEITLDPNPNSNYNPIDIQIDGKSEQETTKGKNLLVYPYFYTTKTLHGITFKDNGDGSITLNGTSTGKSIFYLSKDQWGWNKGLLRLEAGTYTFKKMNNSNLNMPINAYKSDGTNEFFRIATTDLTKTFTESVELNIRLEVYKDGTFNNFTIYPQIEQGSQATNFEPYTGGQPSPSPDYPQEIESVSGVENLLKLNDGTYTSNGVTAVVENGIITLNGTATANSFVAIPFKYTLLANKEYTLSANNKSISDSKNGIRFMGETTTLANFGSVDAKKVIKYTANKTITNLTIRTESGTTYDNFVIKPMLEKGSILHDYVPYGSWLQVKNTGKNLLKFENINETTKSGITYSVKDDVITLNGKNTLTYANTILTSKNVNINATEDKNYTVSFKVLNSTKNVTLGISFRNANNTQLDYMQITGTNLSLTKKISSENINNTSYFQFYVRTQEEITNLQLQVQLEQSSTATEYEPYKEQSTLIDMNKPNLFDKDNANEIDGFVNGNTGLFTAPTNRQKSIYIEIEPNTTYTVFGFQRSTNIGTFTEIPVAGTSTATKKISGVYSWTFTSGSNDKYLVCMYNAAGDNYTYNDVKLYEGVGTDDYYELCSIGDTKDKLNIDKDGNVSIKQNIGEVVLDGSEFIEEITTSVSTYKRWSIAGPFDMKTTTNAFTVNNLVKSDKLKEISNEDSYKYTKQGILVRANGSKKFMLNIDVASSMNLTDFKSWLSNNPVTVYYVLAEPQTISLGKITPLKLLEGTNNITNNDELQPNMKIEYYTDVMGNPGIIPDYDGLPVGSEIDFDGTEIPDGFVQVDDPSIYSSEEVVIGTWFGKKLYRKTFYRSALINGTQETVAHGIQNVDKIWQDISMSFAIWPTGYQANIPFLNNANYDTSIFVYEINSTSFKLKSSLDRSNLTGYITLLYTKTTD